ncbi:hypothetical protein, partial [Klebsiella pneumoniae]|uniref:hypothetical protein n=1 Tax=Klebsiella pneumoniae TaxID=573 RepID=UPI0030138560
ISFSATLYLVFAQNNNWILIPIVGLALLPVYLFVVLQFSLIENMMRSTYGSILRPKKEEKLTNIWE